MEKKFPGSKASSINAMRLLLSAVAIWSLLYSSYSLYRDLRLHDEISLAWAPTNPSHWFNSAEMCVINNWNVDFQYKLAEFSSEHCHGYSEDDEWKGLVSVGYGTHYRTVCTPPLTKKHKLFQALQGFNDSKSPFLLPALRELRDSNRTVVFLGDSVTRQSYIAFLAEIKRLDPRVGGFH